MENESINFLCGLLQVMVIKATPTSIPLAPGLIYSTYRRPHTLSSPNWYTSWVRAAAFEEYYVYCDTPGHVSTDILSVV